MASTRLTTAMASASIRRMKKAKVSDTHTLYLRDFPRDVSRELKSRAALAGQTITAFVASFLRDALKKSA